MTDCDVLDRGLSLLRDAIYGGQLVTDQDKAQLTEALRHSGLRVPFTVVAVQPEGRDVRSTDKRVRTLKLHAGLEYWCITGDPDKVVTTLEQQGVLFGAPQPCPTIDKLLGAIRTSVVDIRFKELPQRHPVPLTPAELADEPRQRAKLLHLIAQEDPGWLEQARRWTAIVSVRHLRSLNNFRRKLVELLAQLSRVHEDKDLGHAFFLLMQQLYDCHTYRGLEGLFPQLLAQLIERLAKGRMPTGDLSRARCDAVKAAASFVRERFRDPISLEDVATAAGVSGAHLARSWRKEIGCSVGEALRGLRLSEARRLLADGNRTVLDVALKCGFGSVEHFHRTFREHQGASPDAWRRSMTDDGSSA